MAESGEVVRCEREASGTVRLLVKYLSGNTYVRNGETLPERSYHEETLTQTQIADYDAGGASRVFLVADLVAKAKDKLPPSKPAPPTIETPRVVVDAAKISAAEAREATRLDVRT